jgi:hypothetical protein
MPSFEVYKLHNVCYDPTRDRTHDYLSRNLIDNSFEFIWKKKQWYDIAICTNLPFGMHPRYMKEFSLTWPTFENFIVSCYVGYVIIIKQ